MQDDVIDLLTQGAVFKRNEGSKAGTEVKVLWLTNQSLGPKGKKANPPQVIYADSEGNVYNRSVESFASQFTFFNVDADLETRLEGLLTFNEDDFDEEDEDEEEGQVADEAVETLTASQTGLVNAATVAAQTKGSFADSLLLESDTGHEPENEPELDAQDQTVVQFTFTTGAVQAPVLSDLDLGNALVAYSQEQDLTNQMIRHRLLFALNNMVDINTLRQTFMPNDLVNTVDVLAVVGPFFNEIVQWTDYMGVYPEVAQGRAFATVVLGESVASPVEEEPVYEMQHAGPSAEQIAYETNPQLQQDIANESPVIPVQLEGDAQTTLNSEHTELPVDPAAPTQQPHDAAAQNFMQGLIQNVAPHNPHQPPAQQ